MCSVAAPLAVRGIATHGPQCPGETRQQVGVGGKEQGPFKATWAQRPCREGQCTGPDSWTQEAGAGGLKMPVSLLAGHPHSAPSIPSTLGLSAHQVHAIPGGAANVSVKSSPPARVAGPVAGPSGGLPAAHTPQPASRAGLFYLPCFVLLAAQWTHSMFPVTPIPFLSTKYPEG